MCNDCLTYCLKSSFSKHEGKTAISFFSDGKMETEVTYQDLDFDSNRMANCFLSSGVKKGDRVILFLPKSIGLIVAHLAFQKIGAISVPLNPGFKHFEMIYMIEDAVPYLILTGREQASIVKEINPKFNVMIIDCDIPYQDLDFFRSFKNEEPPTDIKPEDPGIIIYTSGTTGKPKGAVLTQKNLCHDAKNIIRIWEIAKPDVICHALPLFHVHGLCFALHTALMTGAGVVMLDNFSPDDVVDILMQSEGKNACTVFMSVPSMYVKMMDFIGERSLNFDHIRLWTSGSAPLLTKDFEKIRTVFGKEPVEREGMSETGMNFSNPLNGLKKAGSIGLPLPELQVKIVNPETHENLAPGLIGEIWLKGPGVTPGYWQKPEETASAFKRGWFKTGDLGKVDEDGYYFLTDRIKNIIISGGENISPKEVETVINRLGNVLGSCVVGIPDEKWGEKVVAVVILKPGTSLDAEEIKKYCRDNIHKWKTPKEILFVEEIPKNRMGKVLRKEVKKLFSR